MLRLIWCLLLALLLRGPALAGEPGFVTAPDYPAIGPGEAKGALIWVHGTYGHDAAGPPPPPDFVGRESAAGFDIWYLNRERANDPLDRGEALLADAIGMLRSRGYRRVLVAGHSRGAWIALTVLAHPGLADGVVAFDPAAHGRREERHAQAMADWAALWARAANDGTHVVLVQLGDDPWDPDPSGRLAIARDRFGDNLMSIFQPEAPIGHAGVYYPAFDPAFGEAIDSFVR